MRWLLFSHWLSPTTISTFLAGVQGDLRGTKLIAFSKPSFRKAARLLLFALPVGEEQRSALQSLGVDGADGSGDEEPPLTGLWLGGLSTGSEETLLLPLQNDGPLGCV